MQAKVNVRRFNPDDEQPKSYDQQFDVEVEDHFTVLDTLIKVREEIDGSLAMRCSCRASICGSCAMRVNGHAVLACKARVSQHLSEDGEVRVEPMGNQPVIKDLVVDLEPFWGKIRAIEPYLQPSMPEPEAEYLASNDVMLHLVDVMGCIMCGACVSDCTVLEVDPNFLGPAALAKAYRFVADSRDEEDNEATEHLQRLRRDLGLHSVRRVRAGLPQGRRADGPDHGAAGEGHRVGGAAGLVRRRHLRLPPLGRLRGDRVPSRSAGRDAAGVEDGGDVQPPQADRHGARGLQCDGPPQDAAAPYRRRHRACNRSAVWPPA